MFGIGLPEMLVILAVALIVVGPDKLPAMARSLARTVFELKKTAESVKEELMAENPMIELKKTAADIKDGLVTELMAENPMIELKKTAEDVKKELVTENPLPDMSDLKAELPDLAELKPDLPNLHEAAKRFQEQVLDVQAEEVAALPEEIAEAGTANETAIIATDVFKASAPGIPLNAETNTEDDVRTDRES